VAEGIETALSVGVQMRKMERDCCVWSALSAPGLRSLILPRDTPDILIAADNDAPGEAAAQDAARRWIARPQPEFNDCYDVLQARQVEEVAHV
jgi:putative DNA primase/helicase